MNTEYPKFMAKVFEHFANNTFSISKVEKQFAKFDMPHEHYMFHAGRDNLG